MRYGVMRYSVGDMVEIDDPGSPFHGRIGKVVYTDHEALRVDVAPKWYWGEGDVKEAGFESEASLQAYPMGTIVEDEHGIQWVKFSKRWVADIPLPDSSEFPQAIIQYSGVLHARKVRRVFLGDLPDRR